MIAVGSQLGPYQILGPLGAGGVGEVFRARDQRLDRDVAIKVLPDRFAQDADRLARFQREAKAVAALAHPNILVLFDFVSDRDVCYAVTELLQGETLRQRLAEAPLPWRKAVEIGASVAEGLAAAHAKGIIHRDLKPGNLFLTADGRVKILDFGLARIEPPTTPSGDTGPYIPAETETGVVMGTVGYMSPEQVRGQPVDARSDLFALGCVLYEMVAGNRAFAAASASEVQAAILRDDPPGLADPRHPVPAKLEQLIRRCLEKKPEGRYQSARDLASELRAMTSDSGGQRPRPIVWLAAAVGLVLALVSTAVLFVVLNHQSGPPDADKAGGPGAAINAVAVLPFEGPGSEPDAEFLGDGISEIIINRLSSLRNLRVRPFSAVTRYKGQNPDPSEVGRELKVQALLTGRVVRQGDRLAVSAQLVDLRDNSLLWGDRYALQFADVFAIQEDIALRISTTLRGRLTGEEERRVAKRHTDNTDAFQSFLRGRHYLNTLNGEDDANRAIASFQQALAQDPDYALAYAGLAEAYYMLSNLYKAPTEVIPEAKKAARKALQLDDTLGEAHAMLGLFLALYDWDWPAAEAEFRRAVELNPGSGTVHLYYGLGLTTAARFADAVAELERAKELDPSSAFLTAYASYALYFAHDYDRAISALGKVVETYPKMWMAYGFLGLCYEQTDNLDKAITLFQTAIQLDDNQEIQACLGHAYGVAGRRDEAQGVLQKMNELAKDHYVSPYNVAMVHLGLGDKEQALRWLQKAAEEHSEWFSYLKVDPRLEPLRTHPRFKELLKRLKSGPAGH
jgi:eukaryotic-like serine/threonine-protein kinase